MLMMIVTVKYNFSSVNGYEGKANTVDYGVDIITLSASLVFINWKVLHIGVSAIKHTWHTLPMTLTQNGIVRICQQKLCLVY